MKMQNLVLLAALSVGLALSACQKKEEGPMEKMGDSIGDATNTREHESMKDAGEHMEDAAKDAKEGVKDAVGAD